MQSMTANMNGWTTEELLDEVIRRSASDGPALQRLETIVIRARLAEGNRRLVGVTEAEPIAVPVFAGITGTTEMGLANGQG